ncbi:MAG: hypothetical protein AAFX05_10220, partial [Planctomycetota bacterium]
ARQIRIVQGLTLSAHRNDLDGVGRALLAAAATDDLLTRDRLRTSIVAFLRTVEPHDPAGVARPLPSTVRELDELLRDAAVALRPALDSGAVDVAPAWPPATPAHVRSVEDARTAAAGSTFSEDDRDVVMRALDVLERAERRPTLRADAQRLAAIICDAIAGADAIASAEWLGDDRGEVRTNVRLGITQAMARSTRLDGTRRLGRIASVGALVRADAMIQPYNLRVEGPRVAAIIMLRRTLQDDGAPLLPSMDDPVLETADAAIEVLQATVRLRSDLGSMPEDRSIRRAWRLLVNAAEDADERALELLAELARSDGWSTSPDIISTLKRQRDAIADLQHVRHAQATLDRFEARHRERETDLPQWVTSELAGQAGDALRTLLRELESESARTAALAEIQAFNSGWAWSLELPGEVTLRRDSWLLSPAQAANLRRTFQREQRAWLEAWATGEGVEQARDALAQHAAVGTILDLLAHLDDAEAMRGLDAWAALHLPPKAGEALRKSVGPQVRRLVSLTLEGDRSQVERALRRWRTEGAAAMTIAHLCLHTRRDDWPTEAGLAGLVAQCASGPAPDAFLIADRAELARLSRWLLELHEAQAVRDNGLAEDIEGYLGALAQPILSTLDADAP